MKTYVNDMDMRREGYEEFCLSLGYTKEEIAEAKKSD